MNKSILQILWLGLFVSSIGLFYFLSLACSIPFPLIVIVILASVIFSYRLLLKNISTTPSDETDKKPLLILAGGIVLLTAICTVLTRKYGEIDSISNWNLAAKYLAHKEYWKQLFNHSGTDGHPDYPFGFSGTTAFFWRLTGNENEIFSLAISYIPTVCIPAILFLELYKKHLSLATVILLIFATDRYYLNSGLNQYADTLLSFYLLGAIIAMHYYELTSNKYLLLLCTAMLGCCLWVKNEGMIICAVFGIFYLRTFLSKQNIKYAIGGAIPFILTFLLFKLTYAPTNDLVSLSGNNMLSFAMDKQRFKLIADYLSLVLSRDLYFLKLFCITYLAYAVFTQRSLDKRFYMISCIFGIYLMIYLFTPRDLDWHLRTSLNRLIVQLSPSAFYIIGGIFAQIKIPHTYANDNKE